jgi:uroporphyrinogen-III synthase
MSYQNVLITAYRDLATPFFMMAEELEIPLQHLPLEHYRFEPDPEESDELNNNFDRFVFVVHGNLRNARYFMEWIEEEEQLERLRQKVNIAADQPTSKFLEKRGIPAVMPAPFAKAIDVIEFLLRISQQGGVLYPTNNQKTEEIPGLLHELEMPVMEFQVCSEQPIDNNTLRNYRKTIATTPPDAILFHNRSSVIRIATAFPSLDFESITCVSEAFAVSQKLKNEGLKADLEGKGSWKSVAELLK